MSARNSSHRRTFPHQLMVKVRVHPRIEVTKWSLYHNSSLSTKTLILDDVELNFPKQATVHEISQSSWQYIQKCETTCLPDMGVNKEDRVLHNGVHLMADKNLVDYGIQKDVNLVTIRRLFVVEGELH